MTNPTYQVYIVECENGSLYTGIAKDVRKRMEAHQGQRANGAKYTKMRRIMRVRALFRAADRSAALKLEYRIKKLSHAEKLSLIAQPHTLFDVVPSLDTDLYEPDENTDLAALTK